MASGDSTEQKDRRLIGDLGRCGVCWQPIYREGWLIGGMLIHYGCKAEYDARQLDPTRALRALITEFMR